MNYRHLYHAGSFADVFKHIVLMAVLQEYGKKDTPFCYIETHAGAGCYDLRELVQKKNEHEMGIGLLLNNIENNVKLELNNSVKTIQTLNTIDPLLQRYLALIKEYYPNYYPGSPLIAESCLREQDQMILMELHPEEYHHLVQLFKNSDQVTPSKEKSNKKIAIHHMDGYQGLQAHLPPSLSRGIIFIDPPFEKTNEWQEIIHALTWALKHFSQGIYTIWYPLKDKKAVVQFKQAMKDMMKKTSIKKEWMIAEMSIYPEDTELGLWGSGMIIINAPWQLEKVLKPTLKTLWENLTWQGSGRVGIEIISG